MDKINGFNGHREMLRNTGCGLPKISVTFAPQIPVYLGHQNVLNVISSHQAAIHQTGAVALHIQKADRKTMELHGETLVLSFTKKDTRSSDIFLRSFKSAMEELERPDFRNKIMEISRNAVPDASPHMPSLILHRTLSSIKSYRESALKILKLIQKTAGNTPLNSAPMAGINVFLAFDPNPDNPSRNLIAGPGVDAFLKNTQTFGGVTNARSICIDDPQKNSLIGITILGHPAFSSDEELLVTLGHELLGIVPESMRILKSLFEAKRLFTSTAQTQIKIEIAAHTANINYLSYLLKNPGFLDGFPDLSINLPQYINREMMSLQRWQQMLDSAGQLDMYRFPKYPFRCFENTL